MVLGSVRKALDKTVTTLLSLDPPVPGQLRNGVTDIFELASRLRGEAVFHPKGAVFRGTLTVEGRQSFEVSFLDQPRRYGTVVRFSKTAGTPNGVPDPLGLAIRILDAGGPGRPFDLLLATTGRSPGLRHVLVPRNNFVAVFTSILPYEIGSRRRFIGAFPTQPNRRIQPSVHALRQALAAEPLGFRIALGTPTGDWHTIASLLISDAVPEHDGEVCFDVTRHVLNGIRPAGGIQRLRGPAYEGSQRGRAARCPLGFR